MRQLGTPTNFRMAQSNGRNDRYDLNADVWSKDSRGPAGGLRIC